MPNIRGLPCHNDAYRGYGDPSYGLMRIGIAPGATEIAKGRPFVGPTGELLRNTSDAVGWPNDHAYDTNTICTFNNNPTPEELEACRPRLHAEISIYKPKLVVCFGRIPGTELLGKDARRGWIYQKTIEDHTFWCMWTYHPSAILQGGNHLVYDLWRDMQKIPLILNDPNWPPRLTGGYELVTDLDRAQEILDQLPKDVPVALDIETRMHDPNTDDLDIYTDDLLCLAISTPVCTYVFDRAACGFIDRKLRWPLDVQWTFHNGPFDIAGLRKYLGVELPLRIDTMYMSAGRDEYNGTATFKRAGQNKLESLSAEYFADTHYKEKTQKSWRKKIEPPPHDLHERNALDAFYTRQLVPILDLLGVQPAYERLVLPAAEAYSQIVLRGAYVDPSVKQQLAVEWGTAYAKLHVAITAASPTIKNPNSRKQLSEYIYSPVDQGGLGLPGGPSTAKAVLREFDHPFTNSIIQMGNIKYLLDHWIFGIDKHIKPDGRIHPNIILHGPETGRRAAHDPPIQTIPKHGERLQRIRGLFRATPRDPLDPSSGSDYVIAEADYSQAEMRIAAYASKDDVMLRDLTVTPEGWKKPDVHLATAIRTGATEIPGVSQDDARQLGKTANFLMLYGGGAQKLCDTAQARGIPITLRDAQEMVAEYRKAYRGFTEWADRMWRMAQDEGYLITEWGRIRRFPLILDPQWRSQVINFPIQSTAGDYTLDSLIKLHERLQPYDSHVLFDIHDSIVFELNKTHLGEAERIIREVMEEPKVLGTIPVDFKYGASLMELE